MPSEGRKTEGFRSSLLCIVIDHFIPSRRSTTLCVLSTVAKEAHFGLDQKVEPVPFSARTPFFRSKSTSIVLSSMRWW